MCSSRTKAIRLSNSRSRPCRAKAIPARRCMSSVRVAVIALIGASTRRRRRGLMKEPRIGGSGVGGARRPPDMVGRSSPPRPWAGPDHRVGCSNRSDDGLLWGTPLRASRYANTDSSVNSLGKTWNRCPRNVILDARSPRSRLPPRSRRRLARTVRLDPLVANAETAGLACRRRVVGHLRITVTPRAATPRTSLGRQRFAAALS